MEEQVNNEVEVEGVEEGGGSDEDVDEGDEEMKEAEKEVEVEKPKLTVPSTLATSVVVEKEKKKLAPFKRVWSDKDEKVILKGLLKLVKLNKPLPGKAVMKGFLGSMKKSFQSQDVTVDQLSNKIRKMRNKFNGNVRKMKQGTIRVDSLGTHEARIFGLSKRIWGGLPVESLEVENIESNVFSWLNHLMHSETGKGLIKPPLSLGEGFLGLIGNTKKKAELEKMWNKLQISEMKAYLEKLELIQECTKAVLDAASHAC